MSGKYSKITDENNNNNNNNNNNCMMWLEERYVEGKITCNHTIKKMLL
jgi:hypothetical protein